MNIKFTPNGFRFVDPPNTFPKPESYLLLDDRAKDERIPFVIEAGRPDRRWPTEEELADQRRLMEKK